MRSDIHSHVLCGIDDGAATLADTGAALAALSRGGVTFLALTPHYYPSRKTVERFLADRDRAFEALCTLQESKAFTFALGAEVYLTESLFRYDDLTPLCYGGTEYMLTELEYRESFTSSMQKRLRSLIEDYSITPVLAHVDRYPFLLQNPSILAELKQMGCLAQVNLSSLTHFWKKRKILRLFEEGLADFFGEDVHKLPLEGPDREKVMSYLEKKAPSLVRSVDSFAKKTLFSSAKAPVSTVESGLLL